MRRSLALPFLLTAGLLAGCASTPPEALKAADTPAAWSQPIAVGAGVWPSKDWWRGFGSAELDRFIDRARQNNLDLAAATARLLEAQASARFAGAARLPSLALRADGQEEGASDKGQSVSSGAFAIGAVATYEADFWGVARSNLRSAQALLKAARSAREGVALSVTADVGLAYLDILGTRQRLSIARQNLDTAKRLLSSVGRMVKAGVSSPLDLVQQQALVAGREADLPVLVEEEKEARYALAILLGQAPEGLTVAGDSLDGIAIPAVAPGLPSDLLARRPDIAEAEARLKAAHADVAAARAAFFPTISLTASGGITSDALAAVRGGSALDDVIVGAGSPGWIYGIGASLVQSIFDGGRKKATREIASAREQELLVEYRRAVFNAFSDVETALGRSSSLAESERKKTEQMEKASEAFDISQRQYRQGLIDLLAVLEAQQTLFDARDQLAQTRLARIKAVLSLYKALGGGWRTPEQAALAGK